MMTRTVKANITTICKGGLCSTISITKGRFDKAIAPRFLNGDVAQMVERSLGIREVRESMPRISNISEEPGNKKKEIREAVFLDQKKTWICTSNMRKEASETVQSLLRKGLESWITMFYLRKTSEETLLYWWVNQRHPSDINSSFGLHQRGKSIGRASDWHVSIWNRIELAEKAISAPNRLGLPQKDVEGNINSTDKTIKDIRLT